MTKYEIRLSGSEGYVVLAACADPDGEGGLFSFDGDRVERIDPIECCSLTTANGRLMLLGWSRPGESTGVFVYDESGIERYFRLDGLGDAHQIAWDGANYILVSTSTNSIVWLNPDGSKREWKAPGDGDCWHINGIFLRDAEAYVSAFGRFTEHRGWDGRQKDGCGIVFQHSTGEDVVTGLNCPHHPKIVDGHWIVCNASTHQVVQIDSRTRRVVRCVQLNGWTRGLAFSDDWIFAGVSAPRHDPTVSAEKASIAVISRSTWQVSDIVPIGSREIGDLAVVPVALANGVRKGFVWR
jgi:acetolactate synthase-1/2/3 large subunit